MTDTLDAPARVVPGEHDGAPTPVLSVRDLVKHFPIRGGARWVPCRL